MEKYGELRKELVRKKVMVSFQLHPSPLVSREDLLLAHSANYVDGLFQHTLSEKELRPIGLPWSEELLNRSRGSVGGFVSASEKALDDGFSALLAGGTHHAHRDRGEGYCVFNDFAVAGLKLLQEKKCNKILIIDLDVHQGNGNSSILGTRDDFFILSLHGEKNYPFKKVPSHLDVALRPHVEDAEYLDALASALEKTPRDWDILFYQAGVDVLKEDSLGTFDLTLEGLRKRDEMVFQFSKGRPVALAIGGGYSKPIKHTIDGHVQTFEVARSYWEKVLSPK